MNEFIHYGLITLQEDLEALGHGPSWRKEIMRCSFLSLLASWSSGGEQLYLTHTLQHGFPQSHRAKCSRARQP